MRPFTYQKATTAADAVSAIAVGEAGTRFLAGGTTLYDLMKLNVEAPSHIVDINSLSELEAFDTSGSNELVFGALARMSDVAADPRLVRDYPALSEALWRAASPHPRNKARPGGGGAPLCAAGSRSPATSACPAVAAPRGKASTAATLCWAGASPALPS